MSIPNRTFSVCVGGITGVYVWTMARIVARRSLAKRTMSRTNEPDIYTKSYLVGTLAGQVWSSHGGAKIAMARPNEADMTPKCTQKVRLGIYRTRIG